MKVAPAFRAAPAQPGPPASLLPVAVPVRNWPSLPRNVHPMENVESPGAPMSDETTAMWMSGSPVGRFSSAATNCGICAANFCCMEVIDDESSIMNSTSSLPGLVPAAAVVTAAVVAPVDESTFGWAHDTAASARAIAGRVNVVEGTDLGEWDMRAPCVSS